MAAAQELTNEGPALARVWWYQREPFWQWFALDLPPDEVEAEVATIRARQGFVLTDTEFQQALAFAREDEARQLRRMAQADLEAQTEYLGRSLGELRAHESSVLRVTTEAMRTHYQERLAVLRGEIERRRTYAAAGVRFASRRFPDGFIDRLKREVPLHELVVELCAGTGLRRTSPGYTGHCPFHEDDSPSFVVYSDDKGGHYYCFGCLARGDHFDLIQAVEGGEWTDAVERLAAMAHTPLPAPVPYSAPHTAGAVFEVYEREIE